MGRIKAALRSAKKAFQSGGWDGTNLSIWHPDHPLNRAGAWGSGSAYSNREEIENDFEGYILGAFKSDGPVFACVTARQFVFSEAVFKFRNKSDHKLFGSPALKILENPWPGGTTSNLLSRMEQDASLAGNSWWTRTDDAGRYGNAAKGKPGERLARLRPDWVTMIVGTKREGGTPRDIDAQLLGIRYRPGGTKTPSGGDDDVFLTMDEVAHYSPIPDPDAHFRGMSWLTPVLRDIEADKSAVKHKGGFFDNAAVPNMAVTFDPETNEDDFNEFVSKFNEGHQGSWNAYKTLFLMGGADVTPLSHDFRAMDFTAVVGKGESRIASCAGVPPSWVGFSEGMQGSALNTGNMAANRRRFADGTIRPMWREAVSALAVLLDVPAGAELWWEESGVAFLREDQRDRAEIMRIDMQAVNVGILAGYEPDAVIDAVWTNDMRKMLGKHTGLVSVQMQPPVDADNDKQEAQIFAEYAKALQALTAAGYTHDSAVEALDSYDLTKLEKDPAKDEWTPSGIPIPPEQQPGAAGGAGKPPAAPGAKPPAQGADKPKPKKPPASGAKPPSKEASDE